MTLAIKQSGVVWTFAFFVFLAAGLAFYVTVLGFTPDAETFFRKAVWMFYGFLFGFLALAIALGQLRMVSSVHLPKSLLLLFPKQLSVGELLSLCSYVGLNVAWFLFWFNCPLISGTTENTDSPQPLARLARALGHLNDVNIGLLLLPTARNSVWQYLLGISWERAIQYHRWIGRVTVLSVTVHLGLWWTFWIKTGQWLANAIHFNGYLGTSIDDGGYGDWSILYAQLAWLCCVIMAITAYESIRRKNYEVFQYTHRALFFLFILGACVHDWEQWAYIVPAFALWLVDRMLRLHSATHPVEIVALNQESCGVTRLEISRPSGTKGVDAKFQVTPGAFMVLNIPGLSVWQWHPFSVSSVAGQRETITFHIKNMGKGTWTDKLYQMAGLPLNLASLRIRAEGPYGHVAVQKELESSSAFVVLAGGIGITPCLSAISDAYKRVQTSSNKTSLLQKVYLHWSIRDEQMLSLSCLNDLPAPLRFASPRSAPSSSSSSSSSSSNSKFVSSVYLTTGANTRVSSHPSVHIQDVHDEKSALLGSQSRSGGRMNLEAIFSQLAASHSGSQIAVFACGPNQMLIDAIEMGRKYSVNGTRFLVHTETFNL